MRSLGIGWRASWKLHHKRRLLREQLRDAPRQLVRELCPGRLTGRTPAVLDLAQMVDAKSPTRPSRPFFTSREVGDILHVTPSSVVKWVNKGLLRAHTTPGGHCCGVPPSVTHRSRTFTWSADQV